VIEERGPRDSEEPPARLIRVVGEVVDSTPGDHYRFPEKIGGFIEAGTPLEIRQ
jgi:hypothetical protein